MYLHVSSYLLLTMTFCCGRSVRLFLDKNSDEDMIPAILSEFNKHIRMVTFSRQPRRINSNHESNSSNYDIPVIECPPAPDGMQKIPCPKPNKNGRYICVDNRVICDGFVDCPNADDEDRMSCMFYKTITFHLDVLAHAMLRWEW
ncbi:uncharacterized protein [Centruroides vittatus]|uniref:uncharacterized protein n=1 Tax=Centruroides vittatus TaxID=120091 RepID=UPI00350EAD23